MTPSKKVQFIESVSKTKLGLHGLQIVVIADKCSTRNNPEHEISFEGIGVEVLNKINGKYIKEKYNIEEGPKFAIKLHEERTRWMKENWK